MNPLDLNKVAYYVNEHIVDFHQRRIASLEQLTLNRNLSPDFATKTLRLIG